MERRLVKEGWFSLKSGSWWPSWTDYWFSLYGASADDEAVLEWTVADDDATLVDDVRVSDISNFAASLLLPGERPTENSRRRSQFHLQEPVVRGC